VKEKKRDNKDLAAKMAAYAATALSALAVAHPASAAIVYNGPHNISVPAKSSRSIDLDGNLTNDFQFRLNTFHTTYTYSTYTYATYTYPTYTFPTYTPFIPHFLFVFASWQMFAKGSNGQFVNGSGGVVNLPAGYSIKGSLQHSTSRSWKSSSKLMASSSNYGFTSGNFTNKKGYMGVRFHSAQCPTGTSNWNYGWIYIDAEGSGGRPNTSVPQIVDWAYETNCNTPIKAGAIPPPEPVPALDEWGMIALAALLSGTAIRRMKKGQSKA
jgi:hypothetical protein